MANVGDSPTLMLNAPVPAAHKVLKKAGLTPDDIDLWEINEAFASVTLNSIRMLGIDEDKVNVCGGAVAIGHPIGASGARVLTTLLYEMARRDAKKGLATLCIGGGMGIALCVERG
ncbi:MAG TPA: acetyl-CoA C-acyltransferase, partial [Allosphingosinicella sp.]